MPRYEILAEGKAANTVVADSSFMEAHYPGRHRLLPESMPFTWDDAGPEYQWLEVGSFYDRFGAAKLPVLASADATVQALVRDTQIRRYIDIGRPDVQQFVSYLGTAVPEVTPEVQAAVLNPHTIESERYVKDLPQPEGPQ